MLLKLTVIFIIATSSHIKTSTVRHREQLCSPNEVMCSDGGCVSIDRWCDGISDCAGGSDELHCDGSSRDSLQELSFISRAKRQARCRKGKYQCRDGSCVPMDAKCDGTSDCPDGSDETFPLCKNLRCLSNVFRCTYGACVDAAARCNGVQDCADNSDELLPGCRNDTKAPRGQFKCNNGEVISSDDLCDGVVTCADGSDETIQACAGMRCQKNLFQCAYGGCVNGGSDCNGQQDCADGSDESAELCNKIGPLSPTTTKRPSGACVLPAYPAHGGYVVAGMPGAVPGQNMDVAYLNITCNPGYGVVGKSSIYCYNGMWSESIPQCVRFCKLNTHPSVEYRCQISGNNLVEGTRPCEEYEPSGTIVRPECKQPNYYYSGVLSFMRCIEGSWDYVAICTAECGRVTPDGEQLVIGGRRAKRGELPWHAGIYRKTTTPYMQICGGSIVSTTVVISAAHCFWNDVERLQPASRFAIGVGKLYRPWNNPQDADAQFSDVSDLRIPSRFQGVAANFQDDIALLILVVPIQYKTFIRPVCVDFDYNFDRRQLQEGKFGKVAGWGLTAENGNASQVLKVVEMPYVKIDECISVSPIDFREYITSDKICAGYRNGTALCKGDSGGGLAFPDSDRGTERFYLRGIVSTAPNNDNGCNAFALTTFTQVQKHEHFIKEYL